MMTESISGLCFARPLWLIALLPTIFLLLFYKNHNSWLKYFKQAKIPPRYGQSTTLSKVYWMLPPLLLYCTLVLILAGPLWEKKAPLPMAAPLVILADVSSQHPKLHPLLHKLLSTMKQSSVGVVVYSGSAHVLSPVTEDKSAVSLLCEALSAEIMPVKGNRPDLAVQEGIKLLRQSRYKAGRLLLITAEMQQNHALSMLALLSTYNQPLDIIDISYNRKNSNLFQYLTKETSGNYLTVKQSSALADLSMIYQHEYQPFGYALLPFVLLSLLLMSRKIVFNSMMMLLLTVSVLNTTTKVSAACSSNYIHAAEQAWINKNYSKAAFCFGKLNTGNGYYNQGNAYAKNFQFEKALEAYNKALEIMPSNSDAEFNRQLILSFFAKDKTGAKNETEKKITANSHAATSADTSPSSPSSPSPVQLKNFLQRKFFIELKNKQDF